MTDDTHRLPDGQADHYAPRGCGLPFPRVPGWARIATIYTEVKTYSGSTLIVAGSPDLNWDRQADGLLELFLLDQQGQVLILARDVESMTLWRRPAKPDQAHHSHPTPVRRPLYTNGGGTR